MRINKDDIIFSLEEGTCTDRAVKHFKKINNLNDLEVKYKKTFDDCLKGVKQNLNSIIILPHIHHLCQELEYSYEWVSLKEDIFLLQNPPLCLVKAKEVFDSKCAVLPTLAGLVDKEDLIFVDADNTQDSAKQVSEGEVSYGVTNETGQKRYDLEIVKELKEINMIWIPYRYVGKYKGTGVRYGFRH